jgi:hypothetical protein
MCNSVRHDLGCGYDPLQGHAPSGPPVLSCQYEGGKVYTLRVQDQAKHTTYSGPPHLALAFLRSSHSVTLVPKQENNQGTLDTSSRPTYDRITQLKLEVGQRESD